MSLFKVVIVKYIIVVYFKSLNWKEKLHHLIECTCSVIFTSVGTAGGQGIIRVVVVVVVVVVARVCFQIKQMLDGRQMCVNIRPIELFEMKPSHSPI